MKSSRKIILIVLILGIVILASAVILAVSRGNGDGNVEEGETVGTDAVNSADPSLNVTENDPIQGTNEEDEQNVPQNTGTDNGESNNATENPTDDEPTGGGETTDTETNSTTENNSENTQNEQNPDGTGSDITDAESDPTETNSTEADPTETDPTEADPTEDEEPDQNETVPDAAEVPKAEPSEEPTEEPVQETITLEGQIIWEDGNNRDGIRPEELRVSRLFNGTVAEVLTVSAAEGWKWVFQDVDKYADGEIIEYTVEVEIPEGYSATKNGFDTINTHSPARVSVSGALTWNDDNNRDGKRPDSITVDLIANGETAATKNVSAADGWKWTFSPLYKYVAGKAVTYSIGISEPASYTMVVKGADATCSYEPEKTSISGSAKWEDNENKDGKRPSSINVKFLADGKEIARATVKDSHGWSWKVVDLPKYRDGGVEIKYSIKADSIDGYTVSVSGYNVTGTKLPEKPAESVKEDTLPDLTIETEPNKTNVNAELENLTQSFEPAKITLLKPEASGVLTQQNTEAIIDYSNTKDGYVMVKYTSPSYVRLKAQVIKASTTYTYNIQPGEWAVLPFSDGNGSYTVKLFKNVVDNKYSTVMTLNCSVTLEDEFAPFIRPNQYVNYEYATDTMNTAASLLHDGMPVLEKVETIYTYIAETIDYDYVKSAIVQSGYLPDLDQVLEEKKGICFDYAALMTGMLRSQNIPCKLVIGYADGNYHAWISVWSPETGWIDNAIFFNGINWQLMDPTFAAGGVKDFSDINYATKYIY